MKPSLALPVSIGLALIAALANAACRCPDHPARECPDDSLARDDALKPMLHGSAIFVMREVDGVDRRFCQMSLWGSNQAPATVGESCTVESIEFFGMPGAHTAEEALSAQCCGFFRLAWPSKDWIAAPLESSWDGSAQYTLAARVVYAHKLPGGVAKRVYTLARGLFGGIVQAPRAKGATPGGGTDGATITSLTVGGVFQSTKHVALYDVAVDYTSPNPATLVEIFTTDVSNEPNLWDPQNRIWQDPHPPQTGHWFARQLFGPYAPPTTPLVGVRITYAAGTPDTAERFFPSPTSIQAVELQ